MAQETGKLLLKKIESGTSKAGKAWTKMTFVVDVTSDPKYPKKIAFDTFNGSLIEFINDTMDGTTIQVDYSVESREWQGRWFSNVNAFKAEVVRVDNPVVQAGDHAGVGQANQMYGQQQQQPPNLQQDSSDLPF